MVWVGIFPGFHGYRCTRYVLDVGSPFIIQMSRGLHPFSLVNFVNTGDPNTFANAHASAPSLMSTITWPKWSSDATNPPILTFVDANGSSPNVTIIADTFRKDAIQLLIDIYLKIGTSWTLRQKRIQVVDMSRRFIQTDFRALINH